MTRVLNGLDPDQDQRSVGPDLARNRLLNYQQTTKVATSKERVISYEIISNSVH